MISHSTKQLSPSNSELIGPSSPMRSWLARASPELKRPAVVVSALLATIETLPAVYYGRYLVTLEPLAAATSNVLSLLGTWATYLIAIEVASARSWMKRPIVMMIAIWTVLLQVVYFGIYREFSTLPTVSVIDFVRQTPDYAWALFVDRISLLGVGASLLVVGCVLKCVNWGFDGPLNPPRNILIGLSFVVLASYCYSSAPFMSFGQQAAWLVVKSSHGPGVVNAAWTPDRARAYSEPAKYPANIVVFRLEEIAAQATTLERPDLPTTPFLKSLVDEHPNEVFVGKQHFSNSTATDVSVLSIYTGLSPAADLEAHRHIPILWDYFSAARYNTSLFMPFHLEWGDFKRRFNARPDELNLTKLVDAGNSGLPLIYDNSINDTDVTRLALDYQRKRAWAQPFLQIVSLKMPHAIGEGARVNKLDYGDWGSGAADLKDYFNGIRHDDGLIQEFMGAIPDDTRDRTIFVFLSDHGTRLFARSDGVEDLHRLDNYHQETTKVPFVVYLPKGVQQMLPDGMVDALRDSLAGHATSNIDIVPTLLGLAGIRRLDTHVDHDRTVLGRDLSRRVARTEAIIQLNTGPLRRWDREHFGLLLDDAQYHYIFSMGRELLFDRRADPLEEHNVILDPAHREIIAKARTTTAEVPELFRIQQKYKRRSGLETAVAHAVSGPTLPVPSAGDAIQAR